MTKTNAEGGSGEAGDDRVPVLLVSGWLGAGKTTLLEHVVANAEGLRIGVLVNDMASVNVDANTLARVVHQEEEMMEFSNGCICCTLRADFVDQLATMASQTPRFDTLIVEASGISEPQQVAEAFDIPDLMSMGDEEGFDVPREEKDENEAARAERIKAERELAESSARLRKCARVDCTVSVVDAKQFPRDVLKCRDTLAEIGQAAGEFDKRSVSNLLLQQAEFADILIVNKCDLISEEERGSLQALLKTLNPRAHIITATRSKVSPKELLQCNRFDIDVARRSAGWLASLSGEELPESVEYGITNILYTSKRPFHPNRLHKLLFGPDGPEVKANSTVTVDERPADHPLRGVVRSKGGAWFASEIGVLNNIFWTSAGRTWEFMPGKSWDGCLSSIKDAGIYFSPETEEELAEVMPSWDKDPFVQDRKCEVVLIGVNMDGDAVRAALDKIVLTDDEWEMYCADAKAVIEAEVERFKAELEEADAEENEEGDEEMKESGSGVEEDEEDEYEELDFNPVLVTINKPEWTGKFKLEGDDVPLPDLEEVEDDSEMKSVPLQTPQEAPAAMA